MEYQSDIRRLKKLVKKNLLNILLVLSVTLGLMIGIIIRTAHTEPFGERECLYIGFPGEILMRLLKCTATPLIICCIIVAIGSLDLSVSKTIGWQLIVLIFATKFLSSSIGLMVVLFIRPGSRAESTNAESMNVGEESTISDAFLDIFRNIVPQNMVRMYLELQQSKLSSPVVKETDNILTSVVKACYVEGMNLLGVIFIATIVGVCLTILEEHGKGLLIIATEAYEVFMKLATWCLWSAPVFLFFLILAEVLKIKSFSVFFTTWGLFIVTVHAGFLTMFLVMYPLLLILLTGENPFKFYWDMSGALVTAFVTASSMAAMPVVMKCLMKHGLGKSLVRFVVPIGVNINKDGSACYLSIGTVFVAQMQGVSLSFGQYVTIAFLATMGSMAEAGVPFSGVIVFMMIFKGVGLDQSYIGGIIAIEWINDRAATFINILSNCFIPKMISKWNKNVLQDIESRAEEESQ